MTQDPNKHNDSKRFTLDTHECTNLRYLQYFKELMMFPHNVLPDTAEINDLGHLSIGGCDIVALTQEFGTPLYIFDEFTLRNRCQTFTKEFTSRYPNTTVAYASKAFVNPALAKIFAEEGLGLDVVSGGELALSQAIDFPSERIYFHGNNKSREELTQAVNSKVGRIVIDSFHEIALLEEISAYAKTKQDVLIRVSPSVDPHTHSKTTTGTLDSKFGLSIDTGDAHRAVTAVMNAEHLNLRGLHFHLGSPIFELEPYELGIEVVLQFAASLREEGLELKEFSPGGGFAISYTREQIPPHIGTYAETIINSMTQECERLGLELPHLTIEPGRAITGPAGVAVYKVGSTKSIEGIRKYVSVDGGMGDNIRPALYEARYEAFVANRMNEKATEMVTIAGKYCESGDILVKDALLPPIGTDGLDLIAIPASGAYCLSMASNYNLNPNPPIVLVNNGNSYLIRRRETYKDQMLLDVI